MAASKPRSNWKGMLSWGMVTIPVSLHTATSAERSPFNLVLERDGVLEKCRQVYLDSENQEHSKTEMTRAVAVGDDYIVVTEADTIDAEEAAAQAVGLERKVLKVHHFTPRSDIDPRLLSEASMMLPDDRGEVAYRLFCLALTPARKSDPPLAAVVEYIDRSKQHLALIFPDDHGVLVCQKMRRPQRLIDTAPWGGGLAQISVDKSAVKMARELIAHDVRPFDADAHPDVQIETLNHIIEQKMAGEGIRIGLRPEPTATPVPDITADLQRMLAEKEKVTK